MGEVITKPATLFTASLRQFDDLSPLTGPRPIADSSGHNLTHNSHSTIPRSGTGDGWTKGFISRSKDSSSSLHSEVIREQWLLPAAGGNGTTAMKHAFALDGITRALFTFVSFYAFGGASFLFWDLGMDRSPSNTAVWFQEARSGS